MTRRESLGALALTGIGSTLLTDCVITQKNKSIETIKFNHSVCRWCYGKIPIEEFADRCKDMGINSIELLNPDEWHVVLDRNMTCAISNGSSLGIPKGFNDKQYHEQLRSEMSSVVKKAADKGIPQVICFSGNRNGISDIEGLENCAIGLEPLVKEAEKLGVNIVMELLNSKIDHKDYQCDHTSWGAELCEKLGSPNFKLLYDIYHMQIMEGDVIRTIRDNQEYIGHYHTGGVPGRNEIDESQELYYPAIMKAINDLDFDGYVAQEFIPKRPDALNSLKQGIEICTL